MSEPQEPKVLGYMYIATRPCGKVAALAWDDEGREKSTAKSVAEWIRRGDAVTRVLRHEGDQLPPLLDPACRACDRACKSAA